MTKLHFQSKVIKFTNGFIYKYDLNMIRENKKARKVSPNEKWIFCNSILICHILNMSAREPLWYTSYRKVKYVSKETEMYQFKVGCMSYPTLKQNREVKEQVERCLS